MSVFLVDTGNVLIINSNMKNINILEILIIFLAFLFSSCEEEARPYQNFDAQSIDKGTVRVGIQNQDIKTIAIDGDEIERDTTSKLYVKMFGPPATSDITVNFTIDPTSEAQLGTHFTLSDTKFVIPAGSSSGSIDITVINSALTLDYVTPFTYTLTDATGYEIDALANSTTVTLYKNCALGIGAFNGNFEMSGDVSGVVKVETNPEVTSGIIISGPIWCSLTDTLKLIIDPDNGVVSGKDYLIYNGNDYEPYFWGVLFHDINSGIVNNNCKPVFEFTCTPLHLGSWWWPGEYTFVLTKTD